MNITDLLAEQFDTVGYQVTKVFEGLKPEFHEFKLSKEAMTPRQQLIHLAEASHALKTEAEGGTYEWGTFGHDDISFGDAKKLYEDLRAKAVIAVLKRSDPDLLKKAGGFISLHEAYHVGQMALVRLACDPTWDAFSLYKF